MPSTSPPRPPAAVPAANGLFCTTALSLAKSSSASAFPVSATQRIAGARRLSDARRSFLHALRGLREYFAQYVGDAAAVRHRPAGLPELVFELREDVAEIGTGALARPALVPGAA